MTATITRTNTTATKTTGTKTTGTALTNTTPIGNLRFRFLTPAEMAKKVSCISCHKAAHIASEKGVKFCDGVCLDLALGELSGANRAELSARKLSSNQPGETVVAYEENGVFGAVTLTQQKRDNVYGVEVKILSVWKDGVQQTTTAPRAPLGDVSPASTPETEDAGLLNADFAPEPADTDNAPAETDAPEAATEEPATLETIADAVAPVKPSKKPVRSPYFRDVNGNLTPEAAARAEADDKAEAEWKEAQANKKKGRASRKEIVAANEPFATTAPVTTAPVVETPAPKSYLADTTQVVDLETGEPLSEAQVQAKPAKKETVKTAKAEVPTEPRYCTVLKMKGQEPVKMGTPTPTDKGAYADLCKVREQLRAEHAQNNVGIALQGGWDTGYVLIDGLGCKVGELYVGNLADLTPPAELMWHPGSTNSLVHPARIYKGALNTARALVQKAMATYTEAPNEANRNALNARMVHLETVIADGEDACHFTPFVGKNAAKCAPGCRKDVIPAAPDAGVETSETPADAPAETPADAPAETPADAPAETPADAPAETPAETPAA